MHLKVTPSKYRELISQHTSGKGLIDAHRHGLYDVNSIKGIKTLSVDQWSETPSFIHFQNRNKNLYGKNLHTKIIHWLNYSINEGVKSIVDFSAKHAREDLNAIYSQYGIKSYAPIKWNNIDYLAFNELKPVPRFVILPDEREINVDIINHAKEYIKVFPLIKFTMHCMESNERKKLAKSRFGCSTIEWLNSNEFLTKNIYLVHVNECSSKDFRLIHKHEANIVLCPLMRKPLNYNIPEIPINLSLFFGTDAPLISSNRSLIDAAIEQAEVWVQQGVDFKDAIITASNGLTRNLF